MRKLNLAETEAEMEQPQVMNCGNRDIASWHESDKLKFGTIVELREPHGYHPKTTQIDQHMMCSPWKAGGLHHDIMLETVTGMPLKKAITEQVTARTTKDIGKSKQSIVDENEEQWSLKCLVEVNRLISEEVWNNGRKLLHTSPVPLNLSRKGLEGKR